MYLLQVLGTSFAHVVSEVRPYFQASKYVIQVRGK